jgi:Zn-dependent protease with chaperone function
MRSKAVFASFLTISMMSLFILILLSPFLAAAGASMAEGAAGPLLGIGFAVLLTVLINVVLWFVSPWIMDLVNRWAYRCRDMPLEELGQYRPAVAQFVYAVCQRHNVKVPTLKLIDDMNPTAYCYGSTANRARLVVTRGLLHYLDDEELAAVCAHELGHIVHRDFIVMTLASTLLSDPLADLRDGEERFAAEGQQQGRARRRRSWPWWPGCSGGCRSTCCCTCRAPASTTPTSSRAPRRATPTPSPWPW